MKTLIRLLLVVVLILLAVTGAGALYINATLRRPLPQVEGTITLDGLDGKVEIYRDPAGVPHIYATTSRDLFFAQGFVTAQDRWWQLEFNRHTGLGRISELTGKNETALSNDKFIRTLGWNRAAKADLDVLSDETKTVAASYSSGVNAYIAGKSGPDLAIEYSVLAVRGITIPIEPWEPLHSLAWAKVMAWSLSGNYNNELRRAALYKLFKGDQTAIDAYYLPTYPYGTHPTILRAADLPKELAAVTAIQTGGIAPIRADMRDIQTQLVGGIDPDSFAPIIGRGDGFGSNNWVLSGKLTASGKPLLNNDPHLGVQMPSIWHQIGLHCTTVSADCPYDVVGFTFPGVPGVVVGHNARMAWGVTNTEPDTQDMYILKVDAADDTQYEVDGKLEKMQVIEESIKFGDSTPTEKLRVRVTRFGPIMTEVSEGSRDFGRPLAMKWVATAEKYDLLGSILSLNRARNFDDFRSALKGFISPAQNFIYADVDGNIGYQTPGLVPIRAAGHDGRTPIDGSTTKYDWKGYIPYDYLPRSYNPPRGYIATANEAVVTPDYYQRLAALLGDQFGKDSNYVMTTDWDYGYRAARIESLIEAGSKHTVESMKAIQGDNYNGSAAEIMPSVLKLNYGSAIPAAALDWLRGWDFQMHMNSGQAALYASFWVNLTTKLWHDEIDYTPDGTSIMTGINALLTQPDNALWDDTTTPSVKETRDDILIASLTAAWQELSKRLGSDYTGWKWGALHTTTFVSSPLGASGIGVIEALVNGGPVATSGSNAAINATSWSAANPFSTRGHPSFRMIVDFNALEKSQWIHSTGQSGHPLSDHYRDQIDKWRMIDYNTMYFGESAVKAAAVNKLVLEPKR